MSSYEFQNTLFRTEAEMLNAVAGEWLSAGGMNDGETMRQFLAGYSDEELARECVEGWGLDLPESEDGEETWMEKRGVDQDDISDVFADMRANFDKHFPA
jgi:hypothetical protein